MVLAHGAAFDAASWEAQATRIAEQGMVALAVEDIAPRGHPRHGRVPETRARGQRSGACGRQRGSGRHSRGGLQGAGFPGPLVLLSANQTVDGLGLEPKLLIASEGEPVAGVSRELAEKAPGDENKAQILPGDAHAQNLFDTDQSEAVTQAILKRLERFSRG